MYARTFLQYVIKRDGRKEPVHFDKITARITKLSYGLNPDFCDPVSALSPPALFWGVECLLYSRFLDYVCALAHLSDYGT